jgi:hypothetical protein
MFFDSRIQLFWNLPVLRIQSQSLDMLQTCTVLHKISKQCPIRKIIM